MNLPVCILCKIQPPGDPEHIIPRVIGGKIQSNILCNKCNHTMGSSLIKKLLHDPTLFFAIQSLRTDIPGIYKSFNKKALFKGISQDGSKIEMIHKGNDLFVRPNKTNDILEIDSRSGPSVLEKLLSRDGYPPEAVKKFINNYRDMGESGLLELPKGNSVRKIPIEKVERVIPTSSIEEKFWVLVAFEFLSLFAGEKILSPTFDPIRAYILDDKPTDTFEIIHLQGGKKYEAIHIMILEPEGNKVKITIRLFRWITVQIKFMNVHYSGDEKYYMEDLISNQCAAALSLVDEKAGKWHPFKT